MKRFKIITFGCQMNEDESNKVERFLIEKGFCKTQGNDADLIIINTCTIRQHAEDKAFSLIGALRKWKREDNTLIVMGCAAERAKDIINKRFTHVDYIVGAKSYDKIFSILNSFKNTNSQSQMINSNYPITEYQTISKGCSLSCSYCIVPSVRGGLTHISAKTIINEIKEKAKNGVREIILLGQTVNAYNDKGYDFVDLLKEIAEIDEIKIIRFMSPHPLYFNERFFKEYEKNTKISRHIHLPLQSASDRILKLMRRGYDYARFKEIVKTLRTLDPTTSISTDIIVGFTSETEDDFQRSLQAVEELSFSMVYCFKYSPRFSNSYPLTITTQELKRRHQLLLAKAKEVAIKELHKRIGNIETILLTHSNGIGKTLSGYNCCIIDNKEAKQGTLVKGKIFQVEKNMLIARREE